MVVLNRIYTRTGDRGDTSLGTGERRPKWDLRIAAYGTIDETNASIGVARLSTRTESALIDEMLGRIQNDLFDLGADLCTPETGRDLGYEPLRIVAAQVTRLENEIDQLNADLEPLRSFVLPGGTPGAAALHVSRTVCRRAERLMTELAAQDGEKVGAPALHYVNRLSDFLFVASRRLNLDAGGDVLWTPARTDRADEGPVFIPLYDKVAIRHIKRPAGVYGLLAANLVLFAMTAALPSARIEMSFGMIPAIVFGDAVLGPGMLHPPAFLTPATSLFLHADVFHLTGNMLFLWVFGDNVEDAMGSARFVVFYLLCGVCAAFAHALVMPQSTAPLIGASGAVSGVITAYLLLHPHVRVFGLVLKWLPLTLPALYVIVAWIGLQFVSALFGGDPEVGWWAHVGGIVAGAILIGPFKRPGVMLFDRRLD